ncbi:MAG: MFS transporter [Tagaea sp.]
MPGPLYLLAAANFAIGMGAFVVIGVLSPLAADFGIDKATAGWTMTSYAIVYAIASPVLVAVTGAKDRKVVLLAGLALFGAGALAAAFAPSFESLLVARGLMALGGGLVTPVAASIGLALSEPAKRGRALATVFGGLTFAQALGVPAGAWLGYAFGWHAAFVVVTALTFAAWFAARRTLPAGIAVPPASLATLRATLASPKLTLAVAFTALFIGGLYVVYTFLAPFLETRLGLGRDGVSAMLLLFGLGAVAGNALGGFLTDRIGAARTLAFLCAAQIAVMPILTLTHPGLAITAALIVLWSVCAWSFMVAQQARLAALDPAKIPVLFALNAAAIYVGGAYGPLFGGAALGAGGFEALGPAGAAVIALAAGSLWLVGRLRG